MLTEDERDWLRLAGLMLGKSVGELRNMILNGYMTTRKTGGEYTGLLGPSTLKPNLLNEFAMHAGPHVEDSIDILCSLWIVEMRIQVCEEKDQRVWEQNMLDTTGEPDAWWP